MPRPRRESPQSLTLQEAAEQLGVHYMTAYRYVRTGRLQAQKMGAVWHVDPRDLDRLNETSVDATGVAEPARSKRHARHDELLAHRLLADDEAGAWQVMQDALSWGKSPESLLFDVIGPALQSIGDQWEGGAIDVSDEHVASAVVVRLLGRLGPLFARRGPKRGTIVTGAPPGDHHGLPISLVADPLRGRGYRVIELGADTPAASFGHSVEREEAILAVVIGATTRRNDHGVADAIAAVRETGDVSVILGGSAIRSRAHAVKLGADHYTSSGPVLLDLVDELYAAS